MVRSQWIVVFGVPGTGKSFLSSRLARRLGYKFTTLSWLVLYNGYWGEYDIHRRSFVVDYDALLRGLRKLSGRYVIETHWLEPFLKSEAPPNLVVFTRTHPLVLYERLVRRAWPFKKIAENVEAELIGALVPEVHEAIDRGIKVIEVDTTNIAVNEAVNRVVELLERGGENIKCCIDWLSRLSAEELEKIMRIIEASTAAEKGEELYE